MKKGKSTESPVEEAKVPVEEEKIESKVDTHIQEICNDIFPNTLLIVIHYININPESSIKIVQKINEKLLNLVCKVITNEDDLKQIIIVLKTRVKKAETKSKEICLEWFGKFF